MSETSNAGQGVKRKSQWKVLGIVLGIMTVLAMVYYFFFPHLDMKAVKQQISEFAATANDPSQSVSLEYILLQGVNEIRWRRSSYLQVKKVAQTGGITIETAIVDAAIDQARALGYIN